MATLATESRTMYAYEDIRQVHLELTDKCNAACPQCPRNDRGGAVNPRLPLTELTLDDIRKILPPDFVEQLKKIYACGNYGDPIVARDCLDIFRYLRECSPHIYLGIHTNGGVRSADFWRKLGKILPKGKGYVRFGIDGLEDTNHIYRRNVRWKTLMRNVSVFVEGGGNAEWDYLVFRHNEHQVDDARRLADELGFTMFNAKRTARFINTTRMEYINSTPIKDKDGKTVGRLEHPLNPAYQNEGLQGLKDLRDRYGNMGRYYDQACIHCKVQARGAIYVSADGYVFPCCWLGKHHHPMKADRRQVLDQLDGLGGSDHIDARKRSVKAIVEDDFFQRLVPGSWHKSSIAEGKLQTCARFCGQGFTANDVQSEPLRNARRQRARTGRADPIEVREYVSAAGADLAPADHRHLRPQRG